MENVISFKMEEVINLLPPEWKDDRLANDLYAFNKSAKQKIVVLDDDPTGVQTIHNVLVTVEVVRKLND